MFFHFLPAFTWSFTAVARRGFTWTKTALFALPDLAGRPPGWAICGMTRTLIFRALRAPLCLRAVGALLSMVGEALAVVRPSSCVSALDAPWLRAHADNIIVAASAAIRREFMGGSPGRC